MIPYRLGGDVFTPFSPLAFLQATTRGETAAQPFYDIFNKNKERINVRS